MKLQSIKVFAGFIVTLLAVAQAARQEAAAQPADDGGWINLMPGPNLKGWKRVAIAPDVKLNAKNAWKLDGKVLLCDGVDVKEMLLYDKDLGDGIFHVEWRFRKVEGTPDYNSGIYVRTSADGKVWHQAQVAHVPKPPHLGDLFGVTLVNGKPDKFLVKGRGASLAHPPGEWNAYDVTCDGPKVTVNVNGKLATTWNDCQIRKGRVGLQAEFFFIEFKNLKFKPLVRKDARRDDTRDKNVRRPIGLDDLAKLVRVSDPQISPNDRSIVVVVSRPNYDKNRHDAELVLVDVATGKQRVLTRDRQKVTQPRWSPSGDRLAFLATAGTGKDARSQLHVMPMDGGDAQRITDAPAGVAHFAWKPDGKEIAYAAPDERANKKAIDKGDDAFEVDEGSFLDTSTPTPVHLWLTSAEGGKAVRLTYGEWSLHMQPPPGPPASPLSWSPDGMKLLFVSQDKPQSSFTDRTTVQTINVVTRKYRPLTDRKSLESSPVFSPDGAQIAYWYWRDGAMFSQSEIWVAPAKRGEGKCLTRLLDRCLYLSAWTPDNKALIVGGNDGTRTALWLQPLDGPARRLDLGAVHPSWGFHVDAQVGKNGGIAFTGSEPGRPTELYYLASLDGKVRRLTDFHRDVAGLDLGKVESIAWQGPLPDGFRENGVLVFPPGFDAGKKYPLVLLIHGGPMATSTEAFSIWAQLIAARGYVVFQPNYRGSDNMGYAFQKAVFNDAGDGPGRDVMAGLDEVKKRGFVDDGRIAVTGWSYGGYMTTWLIGNYPSVWKTAIAGAAVTDWFDSYNLSDLRAYEHHVFGGSPWLGKDKAFRDQSPITYAKKIKTPTLIVATTGDARVPITQSYRLYHALRDNGVPVRFIAYPVSGHFPGDPVRYRDLMRRWTDWLDRHLQGGSS